MIWWMYLVLFLVPVSIAVIAKIALSVKAKNTNNGTPALTKENGKKENTPKTSKAKRGGIVNFFWKIFWLIVAFMIFAILAYTLYDKVTSHPLSSGEQKTGKVENAVSKADNSSSSSNSTEDILVPMDDGMVGPGTEWITDRIDYLFKFRTDGHAFNVQFTSKKGGWTESVKYPKEGNYNFPLPKDKTKGPARVTTGPGETGTFLVQLYKRIPR